MTAILGEPDKRKPGHLRVLDIQRGKLMAKHAKAPARGSKKLASMGLGSFVMAAAFAGLSGGTASADLTEVAPGPVVTSRQASENSVIRINDFGVARGISEARLADSGIVHAGGSSSTEVRDTTKAVVGKAARPFEGAFPVGPALGDW